MYSNKYVQRSIFVFNHWSVNEWIHYVPLIPLNTQCMRTTFPLAACSPLILLVWAVCGHFARVPFMLGILILQQYNLQLNFAICISNYVLNWFVKFGILPAGRKWVILRVRVSRWSGRRDREVEMPTSAGNCWGG